MKYVLLGLLILGLLIVAGGWATDRFGGTDARVNMDSLPVYMLGFAVLAIDFILLIGYALYRLFFT